MTRFHCSRKALPNWLINRRRPGFWPGRYVELMRKREGLLGILFRWLLRRGQAFKALEQLFLGHAVRCYLSIVGVDTGARTGTDQRYFGLGLVNLDVFLQAMNEIFLEIAR